MRARALPVLIASALALLAIVGANSAGLLESAEQRSLDARFTVRGEQPVEGVTVVGIDEDTFSELEGVTWPFRRNLHARAIDALRRAGARQIVYDVQFTEPSQRPADDWALFDAIKRAGGVILATGEVDKDGRTMVLGGERMLRRADATAAMASLPDGQDAIIRRYEPEVAGVPTLARAVATALGAPPSSGSALIDFRGPPGTVPTVSFSDLIEGRVDSDLLRDRIIVVGGTASSLQDLHSTSAGGGLMVGPEIVANAILTALDGNPLRLAPGWLALLALIACAAIGPLAVLAVGPLRGALAVIVAGIAYAGAAQAAFNADMVLPLATPLILMAGTSIAAIVAVAAVEVTLRHRIAWRNSELEAAVNERTEQLEASQVEMIERLARAAELRDDDTGQHVDRMSHLCELVALELGQSEDEAALLRRAAVLHDIGKLGLPDGILRKPGRLTQDEILVMRCHTIEGGELLSGSPSPILQLAERIALTHHERWDGTGYPAGLAAEAIPLAGRIAAVCDVFDALVSRRPYKGAWSVAEAAAEITRERGRHFDPTVADALLEVVGRKADAPDAPAWVADIASFDEQPEDGAELAARRDVTQPVAGA